MEGEGRRGKERTYSEEAAAILKTWQRCLRTKRKRDRERKRSDADKENQTVHRNQRTSFITSGDDGLETARYLKVRLRNITDREERREKREKRERRGNRSVSRCGPFAPLSRGTLALMGVASLSIGDRISQVKGVLCGLALEKEGCGLSV
jgi:hypothetical protein